MLSRYRPYVGLAGAIFLAMTSELNEQVSSQSLPDILGALHISHDAGTWVNSLYLSAEIVGMSLAPWMAATFGVRRFAVFVAVLVSLSAALIPFASSLVTLYTLRIIEGLAGGFCIPLLLLIALRALKPEVKLYGLAFYALTSTFFPNLSIALAGLWTDIVDWRFVFWQALPYGSLAASCIAYGVQPEPIKSERLKLFDWKGTLLIIVGLGAFSTMLQQGDRFDWFNSPVMSVLALISIICIPLLFINEWFHPLPLFRLQLLEKRNFAYGSSALVIFLIMSLASSTLPATFLQQVAGYRPEQIYPVTLEIALTQIFMLPIMAIILNKAWVDSRVVSLLGIILIFTACTGDSFLTVSWNRNEFYLWQIFMGVGETMVVMPLLLMATNALHPSDSSFASALVNIPRALAQAIGIWMLQLINRWRGGLHSDRLVDRLGLDRFRTFQADSIPLQRPAPLLPNGMPRSPDALSVFKSQLTHQTRVLELSDAYIVLAAISVTLALWVVLLPIRTFPPRLIFVKKSDS